MKPSPLPLGDGLDDAKGRNVEITQKQRVESVDLLRGWVMVIMALDHSRYFLSSAPFGPTDLSTTTAAYFLTRWVTHFCAPTFIFLAGLGAFYYGQNKTRGELSRFLWTRGLWFIFLELTVVNFGWNFTLSGHFPVQVMWAIGWSMVILAILVFLPVGVIGAIAVLLIFGHNGLDGIHADQLGKWGGLWRVLHEGGTVEVSDAVRLDVIYPLIPWCGLMAAGYVLGELRTRWAAKSVGLTMKLGVVLVIGFLILRAHNGYGDPHPWTPQSRAFFSVFSFLKCNKYPPSLDYLLMTIGPLLMAWSLVEAKDWRGPTWLRTIGRAPLFFYLLHAPIILTISVCLGMWTLGKSWSEVLATPHKDYGHPLPVVYALWIGVVLALYPLCRWYDRLKRRSKQWWWSYL